MAELIFIGLNVIDAYLLGMNLGLGVIEINPMVPPLAANAGARGLTAIAIIIIFYLIKKGNLLGWANLIIFGLISWHFVSGEILHLAKPS